MSSNNYLRIDQNGDLWELDAETNKGHILEHFSKGRLKAAIKWANAYMRSNLVEYGLRIDDEALGLDEEKDG